MPSVSLLAVVLAALVSTVLGFLWYGPLFGKPWMKEMGWTKEKIEEMKEKSKGMSMTYVVSLIGAVVMVYVLGVFLQLTQAFVLTDALMLAFWAWLGFIVPFATSGVLYEGKSYRLFALNVGYQLVSLLLAAIVFTVVV